jgi:hypothetical protein
MNAALGRVVDAERRARPPRVDVITQSRESGYVNLGTFAAAATLLVACAPTFPTPAPPPGEPVPPLSEPLAAASPPSLKPGGSTPVLKGPAELWTRVVDGDRFMPIFATAAGAEASERVDRQPKVGYAEVVYRRGKYELATVTILDTMGVPGVRERFEDAKETAAGFPLKTSGFTKSTVLVGDRFQVQVQSQRLEAAERKTLLEKMDLKALQTLK